jgi:hypothetical protein
MRNEMSMKNSVKWIRRFAMPVKVAPVIDYLISDTAKVSIIKELHVNEIGINYTEMTVR